VTKQPYDDEFKLEVVRTYLEGTQGVRIVARSFGLPSKNYIHRWIAELTKRGLLDPKAIEAKSKLNGGKQAVDSNHSKTPREKQLEREILRLRAENDFLKKLEELERRGYPNK